MLSRNQAQHVHAMHVIQVATDKSSCLKLLSKSNYQRRWNKEATAAWLSVDAVALRLLRAFVAAALPARAMVEVAILRNSANWSLVKSQW